jgi:DNA polymerase-3 subunit delta
VRVQARPEDLARHLRGVPAPLYFVTGDETLLVEESCAAILEHARTHAFVERTVMHADGTFKWHDINAEAASLSLFAERKVVDVRALGAKFDKDAAEAIGRYQDATNPDTILMVRTGRLDKRTRYAKWFKRVEQEGLVVMIWPMDRARLPRWLEQRARAAGVGLTRDGLAYLAGRVEGNLLAAVQEIEILKLANADGDLDADAVARVVEDSSHFDTFELIDAVFAGEPARVHHILDTLREEGVAIFAILGALTAQLRMVRDGRSLPGPRQKLVSGFVQRVGAIGALLAEVALVDVQGKGGLRGDAWVSLENVLLRMAGVRTLSSPERERASLRF